MHATDTYKRHTLETSHSYVSIVTASQSCTQFWHKRIYTVCAQSKNMHIQRDLEDLKHFLEFQAAVSWVMNHWRQKYFNICYIREQFKAQLLSMGLCYKILRLRQESTGRRETSWEIFRLCWNTHWEKRYNDKNFFFCFIRHCGFCFKSVCSLTWSIYKHVK